jgi:hypothetical protein
VPKFTNTGCVVRVVERPSCRRARDRSGVGREFSHNNPTSLIFLSYVFCIVVWVATGRNSVRNWSCCACDKRYCQFRHCHVLPSFVITRTTKSNNAYQPDGVSACCHQSISQDVSESSRQNPRKSPLQVVGLFSGESRSIVSSILFIGSLHPTKQLRLCLRGCMDAVLLHQDRTDSCGLTFLEIKSPLLSKSSYGLGHPK